MLCSSEARTRLHLLAFLHAIVDPPTKLRSWHLTGVCSYRLQVNIIRCATQEIEEKGVQPELYPYGSRGPVGSHYLASKYGVRWGDILSADD